MTKTHFVVATLTAACGGPSKPAVGEARMVMVPARPADCALQMVPVRPEDMAPGGQFGAGGQYQMIGAVTLGLAQGTDVMSEEVRKLVRPRACGMGGEVVSLLATGDSGHYEISGHNIRTVAQTDVVFTVWGPRTAPTPQQF